MSVPNRRRSLTRGDWRTPCRTERVLGGTMFRQWLGDCTIGQCMSSGHYSLNRSGAPIISCGTIPADVVNFLPFLRYDSRMPRCSSPSARRLR